MLKERRVLWHPESPGSRVPVFVYPWSRRRFATIRQVLRYYRALQLVTPRASTPETGEGS